MTRAEVFDAYQRVKYEYSTSWNLDEINNYKRGLMDGTLTTGNAIQDFVALTFGADVIDDLTPFYTKIADSVKKKPGELVTVVDLHAHPDRTESYIQISNIAPGDVSFDLNSLAPIKIPTDPSSKTITLSTRNEKHSLKTELGISYVPAKYFSDLYVDNLRVVPPFQPVGDSKHQLLIGNEATKLWFITNRLNPLYERMTQ